MPGNDLQPYVSADSIAFCSDLRPVSNSQEQILWISAFTGAETALRITPSTRSCDGSFAALDFDHEFTCCVLQQAVIWVQECAVIPTPSEGGRL